MLKSTHLLKAAILAACISLPALPFAAYAAETESGLQASSSSQQGEKVTISGVVLDENNEPVIGANIVEEGVLNGAVTDLDGSWTLTIGKGGTIIVSCLGYTEQKVRTGNATRYTVTLETENLSLNETVVVGYGSVKKSNLTNSVAKINSEALEDRAIANVGEAFQGQLSGVRASAQGGGLPGSELTIQIRGINTINGKSSPLYVIDGVPRDNMSDLNPNDIASIQILKDASATSIYGSRGASGVVLIETKQGKGKPTVSFDAYAGFQTAARTLNLMSGPEYVAHQMYVRNVNHLRKGGSMSDPMSTRLEENRIPDWWLTNTDFTDWQKAVLRTAPTQNYQVSASAKGDVGSVFFSVGYLDQQGIVVGTGYYKLNGRLNASLNIGKRLVVGINVGASQSTQNQGGGGGKESPLHHAIISSPLVGAEQVTNATGIPAENQVGCVFTSPLLRLKNMTDRYETTRLNASIWGEVKIIDGLKFKTQFSGTYDATKREYFMPATYNRDNYLSAGSSNSNRIIDWTIQNTLTYEKVFSDKHSLNLMLGQSAESYSIYTISAEATGWQYEDLITLNLASTPTLASTFNEAYRNASFFGRASYSYDDKYLFSASVRRDGSSRFGANRKWGTFPSVSVGWKINKESFLSNASWLELLKVRVAWGLAGNDNMGSNYPSVAKLGTDNAVYNGSLVPGAAPSNLPNADLQWEATQSLNFGVDFSAFKNRLQLNVDYYINNTDHLLFDSPVPYTTGFDKYTTNVGAVRNSGIELDLTSVNISKPNFSWTSNLNVSHNKNTVTDLGDANQLTATSWSQQFRTEVGKPLSQFIAYKTDGLLTKDCFDATGRAIVPILDGQEEGNPRYVDVNNDGRITSDDMTVCGDPFPDVVWGFTNKFTYKNFYLSFLLQGQIGGEILYIGGRHNDSGTTNRTSFTHWLRSYKTEQEMEALPVEYMRAHNIDMSWDGKTPNAFGKSDLGQPDDRRIFDAGYVRIKNIAFGYNLPERWLKNTVLKGGKLYFSVDNVHIFSNYPGFTPESSTNGNGTTIIGADYSTYPLSRRFIFGVNLTF
ncbi:MAG: TonB-dependent receptor [Bacteroidales bacterium]|nr:TonB-dependent receptor [Bacteroidales bacterium]